MILLREKNKYQLNLHLSCADINGILFPAVGIRAFFIEQEIAPYSIKNPTEDAHDACKVLCRKEAKCQRRVCFANSFLHKLSYEYNLLQVIRFMVLKPSHEISGIYFGVFEN